MTGESDLPVGLYVAAYTDPDAARADWDHIHELAREEEITVEALVLVRRDCAGKIHEETTADDVRVGNILGVARGGLIGLIFPPALVGSGLGAGGLVSHEEKKEIKAEVANDLPVASWGIVVLAERRSAVDAVLSLSRPDFFAAHQVDRQSLERAKNAARLPDPSP